MATDVPDTIDRNGIYQFKKRVPSHLLGTQEFGSAKFIQFSLDTRDRAEAIRRASVAREEFDRRVSAASGHKPAIAARPWAPRSVSTLTKSVPTFEVMLSVAEEYRWQFIRSHPTHHDYRANMEFGHLTSSEIVAARPLYDWLEIRDELQRTPLSEDVTEHALRLAERYQWHLSPGSNEFVVFCDLLTRAKRAALKVVLSANEGDGFELLLDSVPRKRVDKTYTLEQAVLDYEKAKPEKREMAKKMAAALRAWNDLVAIQPIALIGKAEVVRFRDLMRRVPQRAGDRFRGQSLAKAIEANQVRSERFETLDPKTIKVNYIGMLNTAVGEAIEREIIDHNPFYDVRVDGSTEDTDRRAFRTHELQKIFDHPIWRGCKSELHRNTPGDQIIRDHYYWPPLIALVTGMRASEIGSLRVQDVHLPSDHPLPHFAVQGTKTPSAVRDIPYHRLLTELGFDDYVRDARRAGHNRLFPDWIEPKGKKLSCAPCQNNFNKQVLKVLDNPNNKKDFKSREAKELTFHCFRQTLEAVISASSERFDESYRIKVMGHRPIGMGKHYRKPDLQQYHAQFLKVVTFDDLDLRHLKAKQRTRRK